MHSFCSNRFALTLGTLSVLALPLTAVAQSRTPPAGSSLAATPPVDQTKQQYNALPADQKKTYVNQLPASNPAASPAVPAPAGPKN